MNWAVFWLWYSATLGVVAALGVGAVLALAVYALIGGLK
jgi:hypothetical protein